MCSRAARRARAPAWLAFERRHITIRNGTVRGFNTAIQINGAKISRSHLVEYLRVTDNAGSGIAVQGDGSVVRHNMLLNNGYAAGPGARFALLATGDGVHVTDNQVIDSGRRRDQRGRRHPVGRARALPSSAMSSATPKIGIHNSRGILISVGATGRSSIVNNRVVNMKIGIFNTGGGSTVFMDNTVGGATTPFLGGVMAGTTNTSY